MQVFNIIDEPDQRFSAILGERRVTFRVRYNPTSERWSIDLAIDDVPVLHARRVVPGIDLLAPFNLGIGSLLAVAVVDGAEPDRVNLPSGAVRLYHASEAEMAAALAA